MRMARKTQCTYTLYTLNIEKNFFNYIEKHNVHVHVYVHVYVHVHVYIHVYVHVHAHVHVHVHVQLYVP